MSKNIKPTLANLEREETAIAVAFKTGMVQGRSLRSHLNNIRKHRLYLAVDCDNFKEYVKKERLPMAAGNAYQLAANGEVEGYLENSSVLEFSDRALSELSKIRIEVKDPVTGKVTGKKHDIDKRRVQAVANAALKERAKALTSGDRGDVRITGKMIKEIIEKKYGFKPPKTMAETLNSEVGKATRLLSSLESAVELNEFLFSDAEIESPGCAKRLATAYSKLASFLRSRN